MAALPSTLYSVTSTVSSKGQVTLPAAVRRALGLRAGTPVEFELVAGGAVVRKGVRGPHPVDRVYGVLKSGRHSDDLLDEMRGPRPRK